MTDKLANTIDALTRKAERSGNGGSPVFKRAILHLKLAQALRDLGYDNFSQSMIKIANVMIVRMEAGNTDIFKNAPIKAENLEDHLEQCRDIMKNSVNIKDSENAKVALRHFNIAKVAAGLGYEKMLSLMTKVGESKLDGIHYQRNDSPKNTPIDAMASKSKQSQRT